MQPPQQMLSHYYPPTSPPERRRVATFLAPTPPHVREGMEMAALRARGAARQRDEDARLAALEYKLSKY